MKMCQNYPVPVFLHILIIYVKIMSDISGLKILRESEDRVEFKEAKKNYLKNK